MTAGTKIFLAIVAVLVAVLVVYYGFLSDDGTPTLVMEESESPTVEVHEEPTRVVPPVPEPRVEPREERPRILGTPHEEPEPKLEPDREPVTEPDDETDEPDDETDRDDIEEESQLEDHAPVRVTDRPMEDGGKDAPAETLRDETTEEAVGVERAAESQREREREHQRRDAPQPPQYTEYTVRPRDTMSSIAAEWFGEAGKWDLIAKANPFVDPNRLTVGQVLRLPPKDAEREPIEGRAGESATIYVVRSGDNLTKIARAYYNDAGLWRLIYDANRRTIGDDPARLRVGMRLTIPPAPRPARSDQQADDD